MKCRSCGSNSERCYYSTNKMVRVLATRCFWREFSENSVPPVLIHHTMLVVKKPLPHTSYDLGHLRNHVLLPQPVPLPPLACIRATPLLTAFQDQVYFHTPSWYLTPTLHVHMDLSYALGSYHAATLVLRSSSGNGGQRRRRSRTRRPVYIPCQKLASIQTKTTSSLIYSKSSHSTMKFSVAFAILALGFVAAAPSAKVGLSASLTPSVGNPILVALLIG